MSQRKIKAMRREQRRIWKNYLEDITGYLKPKPKRLPWWLWTWMQKQVLRTDKIDPRI